MQDRDINHVFVSHADVTVGAGQAILHFDVWLHGLHKIAVDVSVSDVAAAARVSLHRALVVAGHAPSKVHFCNFGGFRQVLEFYFGHEDPLCYLAAEWTLVHVAFWRRLHTLAQFGCLLLSRKLLIMRLNLLMKASIVLSLLETVSASGVIVRPVPDFFHAAFLTAAALDAIGTDHSESLAASFFHTVAEAPPD